MSDKLNSMEMAHALFRALFAFVIEYFIFTGRIMTQGNGMDFEMNFLIFIAVYVILTIVSPKMKVISIAILMADCAIAAWAVMVTGKGGSVLMFALPFLALSGIVKLGTLPGAVLTAALAAASFALTAFGSGAGHDVYRYVLWGACFFSVYMSAAHFIAPRAVENKKLDILYLDMERRNEELEKRVMEMEQKLNTYTIFDTVTGLKNFRYFRVRVEEEISRAHRMKYPFALCVMSVGPLDEFVHNYGRQECDKVMARVSQNLLKLVRDTDLVAKHAEDQFAMLFPQATPKQALIPIMRIKKKLDQLTFGPNNTFQLDFSFGVSGYPDDVQELGGIFSLAASALERSIERKPGSVTIAESLWRPTA